MTFEALSFSFSSCASFLQYLLEHDILPATVLVCRSREAFLTELMESQIYASEAGSNASDAALLTSNTIQLIAQSQSIKLAYAESLAHARAYLSSIATLRAEQTNDAATQLPVLAMWGLIDAHKQTREYTAQGLSRSLSLASDVAYQAFRGFIIAECVVNPEALEGDGRDSSAIRQTSDWEQPVPLLNESIRFDGSRHQSAVTLGEIVRTRCKTPVLIADPVTL